MPYPRPIMPRSTAHLEERFEARRAELAAEWLTPAPTKLDAVLRFIRSHGHQALAINGDVHFECADGIRHQVRSMAEAREALGY